MLLEMPVMKRLQAMCLALLLAIPLLASAQETQALDMEIKGMSLSWWIPGAQEGFTSRSPDNVEGVCRSSDPLRWVPAGQECRYWVIYG
jgi:hypothetical protein